MRYLLALFIMLGGSLTRAGGIPNGTEWTVRHLSIQVGSPGITLSGQLAIPKRAGRLPAVLLVSGNGPHTREQTVSGCPTFRMISDDLVSRGIAVMTVDARGFGFSTGPDEMQTTTAERTLDARACLEVLKKQPEIDPARIGIIGHSEGAMIALMLAGDANFAKFAILLGCPGEPCGQIWIEQKLAGLAGAGATQPTRDAVRKSFERFVAQGAKGFESDAAYYDAGKDVLRAHGVEEAKINDAFVDKILSDLRTPHMKYFLGWDPGEYIGRVQIPILAIWGELDTEVPPARNVALFERAQASTKILVGQDHFFLTREGHKPGAKHAYGRMQVSSELLMTMVDWIESTAKR